MKLTYTFVISLFFLASCSTDKPVGIQQRPLTYPVLEVPLKTISGYNSYPASIEGTINSAVRAKVPGYILEVLVDEGQAVRKNQVLFRLETQSLNEDAGAASANVNAAEVEVNKLTPLVEKGIISNVQLETAKARLSQAQAAYNGIVANINYATIRSPVDGNVGAIPFREGALVSPSDPVPLTTVSKVEKVFAFFSLNEREYLNILESTEGSTLEEKISHMPKVSLELVNGREYDYTGEIVTITGQVNPSTGTVSFRATFPNPDRILSTGNSGRVRVPKVFEDVAVVPEVSTFEQQGKTYVFKVNSDSTVVSTPIEIQDRIDQLVVISSGLESGDRVVYEGVGKLQNQNAIIPEPIAFDSIAQSLKVVFK
ncbi:MAG TPA: efflux RND transporter periplasmic adaptor subunit [Lunatimonas sp.]|nr:efflux RND transporter periplasmic adaptor subunit [Lunatimonas sp.]